jgi:amino acid transporter
MLTLFSTAAIALTNGGYAGLIYTWLIAWLGFVAVYASMAEMASMAPTTGGELPQVDAEALLCILTLSPGQYHWVSEFAPAKYQSFLSYVVGTLRANFDNQLTHND